MAEGALAGLRVLDLSDHRGIMAGRLLGLMGADVLSIEPPGGSAARRQAPFDAEGQSFLICKRRERSSMTSCGNLPPN